MYVIFDSSSQCQSAVCECDITWPYSLFYIDSHCENIKPIFLEETARPRALIFGKYIALPCRQHLNMLKLCLCDQP